MATDSLQLDVMREAAYAHVDHCETLARHCLALIAHARSLESQLAESQREVERLRAQRRGFRLDHSKVDVYPIEGDDDDD